RGQRADAGEGAAQAFQAQAAWRQQAGRQGVEAAAGAQQALPQQLEPALRMALVETAQQPGQAFLAGLQRQPRARGQAVAQVFQAVPATFQAQLRPRRAQAQPGLVAALGGVGQLPAQAFVQAVAGLAQAPR